MIFSSLNLPISFRNQKKRWKLIFFLLYFQWFWKKFEKLFLCELIVFELIICCLCCHIYWNVSTFNHKEESNLSLWNVSCHSRKELNIIFCWIFLFVWGSCSERVLRDWTDWNSEYYWRQNTKMICLRRNLISEWNDNRYYLLNGKLIITGFQDFEEKTHIL
jgi:hypothetical protein